MKRLVIAIVFMLISITICVTGYYLCIDRLEDLNNSLGQAIFVSKNHNDKELKNKTKIIEKEWEEDEKILGCFLSHDEVEDIDQNIKTLSYYAAAKNYYDYSEACNKIINSSKHVIESNKVKLNNIF